MQSSQNKSRNSSPTTNSRQEFHFASSKLFNSPDPSALPIPLFDEFLTVADSMESVTANDPQVNKTDTLRKFLNIRPVISA
jgi:hypothetical protein